MQRLLRASLALTMALAHKSAGTFELRPGVVVDPNRSIAYLMKPGGSIEAVDLSSGKPIWSTARAAKPLLINGDLLIAQADPSGPGNLLRILGLDTNSKGRVAFISEIKLPGGVTASIDEGLGTSFLASARMQRGDLIISWRFSQQEITGVSPRPDSRTTRHQASGAARVNLKTGAAQNVEHDLAPGPTHTALPHNVELMVKSGTLPGTLWHSAGIIATVTRASHEGREEVILRRWRSKTGEALPDVKLFDDGYMVQFASADGRHLLASKSVEPQSPAQGQYLWSIFSLATGARVAEIRHSQPAASFFLSGNTVIYESAASSRLVGGRVVDEPLAVRATDLKTGAALWSRPVRDTTYSGPYPPGVSNR